MIRSFALKTSGEYLLLAARYLRVNDVEKANRLIKWARFWTNKATELA